MQLQSPPFLYCLHSCRCCSTDVSVRHNSASGHVLPLVACKTHAHLTLGEAKGMSPVLSVSEAMTPSSFYCPPPAFETAFGPNDGAL